MFANRDSVNPQIVMLAETSRLKRQTHVEYISTPMRMNCYLFQDERSLI